MSSWILISFTALLRNWTHDHQVSRYTLTNAYIYVIAPEDNSVVIIWSLKPYVILSTYSAKLDYMYGIIYRW